MKELTNILEQFDTLNLKPNTWVAVKGLGRKYVDQVDYGAKNPDNKFGHMAALVKDGPGTKDKGQWVSYEDLEYQYDGADDTTPQDEKPLSNIMNEVRGMKRNIVHKSERHPSTKKSGHGPTPEHFFKKFNKGEEHEKTKGPEQHQLVKSTKVKSNVSTPDFEEEIGQNPLSSSKPSTLGTDKSTSLSNMMPKAENVKCPQCESTNTREDESIQDMQRCEDCGFQFTKGDLQEAKITGALKKWQDEAKKVAKDIFKEKAFNKLSDQEQARTYLEADKKRRMSKISTMKNNGDINRDE